MQSFIVDFFAANMCYCRLVQSVKVLGHFRYIVEPERLRERECFVSERSILVAHILAHDVYGNFGIVTLALVFVYTCERALHYMTSVNAICCSAWSLNKLLTQL